MSKKSRLLGRGKKSATYRGHRLWHKDGSKHCRKSRKLYSKGGKRWAS